MGLFSSFMKPKKPVNTRVDTINALTRKAQQGDIASMMALGEEYSRGATEMGITLQASREEGAKWYQKAAEAGNEEAMFQLGRLYDPHYGITVRKDPELALHWYDKACQKGSLPACACAGRLSVTAKNYAKARQYFSMGAEGNNPEALVQMGRLYELGRGVSQNYQKALIFYRRAAHYGNVFAELYLGDLYYYGIGVEPDLQEAAAHYRIAKQNNVPAAEAMIDYMMLKNEIPLTAPENDVFRHLLRLSDSFSRDRGGYLVGTFFETGYGVDQNYTKALEYYGLSAKAGHIPAMKKMIELEALSWPGHTPAPEKAENWRKKLVEAEL